MTGGVWKEVVYDNMKNVVSKFIGKNEKELNRELLQMALYYGYTPNVTNCFKANEKGHVESSVQVLRNQIFAGVYKFISLDEARNYMTRRLMDINAEQWVDAADDDGMDGEILMDAVVREVAGVEAEAVHGTTTNTSNNNLTYTIDSISTINQGRTKIVDGIVKTNQGCKIEEEKKHLLPYRPPLELAVISEHTVDSYGFITVDNCKYSVPEYFVGKKVIVKKYHDEIRVYPSSGTCKDNMVCRHKRIFSKDPHSFGKHNMSVDIYHYLETLLRKPGAVRNSVTLKSIPKLEVIFDTHYAKEPKKFIETFIEHKGLCVEEIISLFEERTSCKDAARAELLALSVVGKTYEADVAVRAGMVKYAALVYNAGIGRKVVLDEDKPTYVASIARPIADVEDVVDADIISPSSRPQAQNHSYLQPCLAKGVLTYPSN